MTPVTVASGNPPVFGDLFVMLWPILNLLVLIALIAFVIWYLLRQDRYRQQLLHKLDTLIQIRQQKNTDS